MAGRHEDSKFFNFQQEHYHLDRRFVVGDRAADRATSAPLHNPRDGRVGLDMSEPGIARRKCRRVMNPFPTYHKEVWQMQSHLAGAQCQRHETGWVCPHRGFRLGSIEPDDQGVILCPLHGLRIDAARSFLIGDKESDVEAARRAGVRGLLFPGGDLSLFLDQHANLRPCNVLAS